MASVAPDPFTAARKSKFDHAIPTQALSKMSDDELLIREAIRNLWPILSVSEKRDRAAQVAPPKTSMQIRVQGEVRRSLHENE